MTRTRLIVAVLVLGVVGLSGCASAQEAPGSPSPPPASSPAPAPTPSATPEPDPLLVSPSGIGSLQIGRLASESELIEYDADHCMGAYGYPELYDPGRWIPVDPAFPFSVYVDDAGLVHTIDVLSSDLATADGLRRVVSTGDDVRAAHSNLQLGTPGLGSTMHYLASPSGNLGFEVGDETMGEIENQVINIRITPPGVVPNGWNSSDALAGGCL
jgi:hypothetical protein